MTPAEAACVEAPLMGEINVYALSTSDTGWIDLLALANMGSNADGEAYFRFYADATPCYLFFDKDGSASTDPSATSTSTATMAACIATGTSQDFVIKRRARYVKAISTGNGYLRITRTSK